MGPAYEGDETRGLASFLGFQPVIPPHPHRRKPRRLGKRRRVRVGSHDLPNVAVAHYFKITKGDLIEPVPAQAGPEEHQANHLTGELTSSRESQAME